MSIDYAMGLQQAAGDKAGKLYTDMYNEQVNNLSPFMQSGQTALQGLGAQANQTYGGEALTGLASLNPNIGVDYQSIQNDPMYQFANNQSREMANRSLARQGLTGSRYAVDALGQLGMQNAISARDRVYGQNVDNYNRGFNQNQTLFNLQNQQGQSQYNKLMGLAQLGQNTAVNLANSGAGYANAMGNNLTGIANAQAGGLLAQNSIDANRKADNQAMWAGIAGTGLANADKLYDVGSKIAGWF